MFPQDPNQANFVPQAVPVAIAVPLEQQVEALTKQVAQLAQLMLTQQQAPAPAPIAQPQFVPQFAPPQAMAQLQPQMGYPAQMPPQPQPTPAQLGWTEDHYWVRIKPLDPKKGHVRRRQNFLELGKVLNGGTGKSGDIPEWVPVNRAQAIQLSRYHQKDEDYASPRVLDIVTEAERLHIDQMEMQARAVTLGLAGHTPQQIAQAMQQPGGYPMAQQAGPPTMPAREAPVLAQGAQPVLQPQPPPGIPLPVQAPAPQAQAPVPAADAGRMSALAGLPQAAIPPLQANAPLPQAVAPPPLAPVAQPVAQPSAQPVVQTVQARPVAQAPAPQMQPPLPPTVGNRGVPEDLTGEANHSKETAAVLEQLGQPVQNSIVRPK